MARVAATWGQSSFTGCSWLRLLNAFTPHGVDGGQGDLSYLSRDPGEEDMSTFCSDLHLLILTAACNVEHRIDNSGKMELFVPRLDSSRKGFHRDRCLSASLEDSSVFSSLSVHFRGSAGIGVKHNSGPADHRPTVTFCCHRHKRPLGTSRSPLWHVCSSMHHRIYRSAETVFADESRFHRGLREMRLQRAGRPNELKMPHTV